MAGALPSLVVALLVALPQRATRDPEHPRDVVETALRAVEGDSVPAARARWEERRRRRPHDRAATLGLATLDRLTYDYPAADRRYAEILSASPSAADPVTVYARLGHAAGLYMRAMLQPADTAYRGAIASARTALDSSAEGEALIGLSRVRLRTSGRAAAMRLLDRAAGVVPASDLGMRARYHCTRAALSARVGARASGSEIETGIELARRAGKEREVAACLHARAFELIRRGAADSATAVLRGSEAMWRRLNDRSGVAGALAWRGYALMVSGDYGPARYFLTEAVAEGKAAGDGIVVAGATSSLGWLSLRVNDLVSALDYANRGAAMAEARGDQWQLNTTYQQHAQIAGATGDLATARRRYRRVRLLNERLGSGQQAFFVHRQLATYAAREGDWAGAERELDAARAAARGSGMLHWSSELAGEYGTIAMRRGDLPAAERALGRALSALDSGQHVYRYDVRTQLAELYARRGELDRAERELASAVDEIDRWRATLADRELRTLAFEAGGAEINDPAFSVATVLAALAADGRAGVAFRLAERTRARELTNQLVQGDALRATARGGAQRPLSDAVRRSAPVATEEEVAAAIPDSGTAVLEYVVGPAGAPSTLFVLTRTGRTGGGGLRARVIAPGDSLAERIARLVALLEGGADPGSLARTLGAELFDPALAMLGPGVTRLVVVPDGPLHRLPFDALRLADGRYVVERYAVGLAPSVAAVTALWRRVPPPRAAGAAPARLLVLGDPTFPNFPQAAGPQDTLTPAYRLASSFASGLPRLEASGDEARAVARYASSADVRLRDEASAAFVKRAPLDGYEVIHFATHALVDDRSVARTALALAPGHGEGGFLSPGDLANLRLNAGLVVLSACRTAGGVLVAGEGVQGLTTPLLQAGARSVVATDWRIGDRSTVALIDAFYAALGRGLPVGEALRAAKLDAIRRGAPPADWAAFTVVGDPLVHIRLGTPRRAGAWWLVAFASAGSAVLAYAWRRRALRGGRG